MPTFGDGFARSNLRPKLRVLQAAGGGHASVSVNSQRLGQIPRDGHRIHTDIT